MTVEPKGGRRVVVEVTARRAKPDFVSFVKHLVENVYAAAVTVHMVLDNLNTHFRKTFVDVLDKAAATVLLRRVTFHYINYVHHGSANSPMFRSDFDIMGRVPLFSRAWPSQAN